MDVQRLHSEDDECIHSRQTSEYAKRARKKKMGPLEKNKEKVVVENPKTFKSKAKKVNPEKKKDSIREKRKRIGVEDIYDDVETKFTILERAGRHLESLGAETPFFVKYMLPSNVSYSFWLIIPRKFGALHLPKHDSPVILVDDWGNEYETSYLITRNGLSAGWRGFALAHKLLKGDILFFRLIGLCKLQVHIVRLNDLDVIRAADSLMNMEASGRATDSDTAKKGTGKRKRAKRYAECELLDVPETSRTEVKCEISFKSKLVPLPEKSNNSSEGFGSEVLEGDLHCNEASFLHEHPREAVTCRKGCRGAQDIVDRRECLDKAKAVSEHFNGCFFEPKKMPGIQGYSFNAYRHEKL